MHYFGALLTQRPTNMKYLKILGCDFLEVNLRYQNNVTLFKRTEEH